MKNKLGTVQDLSLKSKDVACKMAAAPLWLCNKLAVCIASLFLIGVYAQEQETAAENNTIGETPAAATPSGISPSAGGDAGSGLPVGAVASNDGYWIEGAPINEVFQYLARKAKMQYLHNNALNTGTYLVTGHLDLSDPIKQMQNLAISQGLQLYDNDNIIHLMTEAQMQKLPTDVFYYQLRYLRGANLSNTAAGGGGDNDAGTIYIEKLKSVIKPLLTPGVGQVEFEEKTNTMLVADNKVQIAKIKRLLEEMDKPRKQVAITCRLIRTLDNKRHKSGMDAAANLLSNGVGISQFFNLTKLLGISSFVSGPFAAGAGDTLFPIFNQDSLQSDINEDNFTGNQYFTMTNPQVDASLFFLNSNGYVKQESTPVVVIEENERGIISIIDRYPIITSQVTQSDDIITVQETVRYKLDASDPDITSDPEKSRELGFTMTVTPSILPDGSIRMKIRPRISRIVEFIQGIPAGNLPPNRYPRASESTIEVINRIKEGETLIIGGFFEYNGTNNANGMPIISDVPLLGKLFGVKEKGFERNNITFAITPTLFDVNNSRATAARNNAANVDLDQPGLNVKPASKRKGDVSYDSEHNEFDPSKNTDGSKQGWFKRMFMNKKKN